MWLLVEASGCLVIYGGWPFWFCIYLLSFPPKRGASDFFGVEPCQCGESVIGFGSCVILLWRSIQIYLESVNSGSVIILFYVMAYVYVLSPIDLF